MSLSYILMENHGFQLPSTVAFSNWPKSTEVNQERPSSRVPHQTFKDKHYSLMPLQALLQKNQRNPTLLVLYE